MKVAVLKGGSSLERPVSLRSGARVEDALTRLGHDVLAIDVGPDLVDRLLADRPDAAFVALHGRGGEDGTVQELLELVGVPYTASRPGACIRCMDKVVAKHALRDAGIPTPDFYAFSQAAFEDLGAGRALPAIEERLDFPLVVKPAGQGSALGIKFARAAADVPGALVAAFSYDTKVMLERYVPGRDLAVAVLDGPHGPEALPVVEAIPTEENFYDFEARYEIGRTRFVCPAELPPEVTLRAQELALATWRTLGCSGFARVDLLADGDELTVLEANAIPGMTDTSLLPLAAEAAGITFDAVVERVLDLAVTRARTPAYTGSAPPSCAGSRPPRSAGVPLRRPELAFHVKHLPTGRSRVPVPPSTSGRDRVDAFCHQARDRLRTRLVDLERLSGRWSARVARVFHVKRPESDSRGSASEHT